MCTVLSIINMKGGVGKTTLSIGIADTLSDKGYKILLIDAYPQFNATQAMIDEYKSQNTDDYYTNEILNKRLTIHSLFAPQVTMEYTYTTPNADDLVINLKKNLDMLCGDLSLVLVNKSNDHSIAIRLLNFIEDNNLRNKYDYIIIDCPPTLTIYTDSALIASDYYLIPNRIDRYSIIGITSLQRAINNLISSERISLKCIGLVYTMVDAGISKKQQQLRENFESQKAVNDIDIFDAESTIVKDIQVGKAGPLPTKYKKSREDIEAISLELLQRISEQTGGEKHVY